MVDVHVFIKKAVLAPKGLLQLQMYKTNHAPDFAILPFDIHTNFCVIPFPGVVESPLYYFVF